VETERNPNEPGKSGGPGQQGGQEGIARDRNVNASSASARSRAVAANKVAVSKADDKADCRCINGRQKLPSAACYASVTCRRIRLGLSAGFIT
jgi:hypothetical protein